VLPTRPTKASDTRAKKFVGESVEVDAIPPAQLRSMVEGAIRSHVDEERYDRFLTVENAERESLEQFVSVWPKS
jgi:hypothetical protein